jgi:hypothetical protein
MHLKKLLFVLLLVLFGVLRPVFMLNAANFVLSLVQAKIKAKECPIVRPDQVGICIQECNSDSDCAIGEKCCFNGCGMQCIQLSIPSFIIMTIKLANNTLFQ